MTHSAANPSGIGESVRLFASVLRRCGVQIPPQSVLDALCALHAIGVGSRAEVFWTLRACLIKNRRDLDVFSAAFSDFFRVDGKKSALPSLFPQADPALRNPKNRPPAQRRVQEANRAEEWKDRAPRTTTTIARTGRVATAIATNSRQDFAQMSSEELAAALDAVTRMCIHHDKKRTHRKVPGMGQGREIDWNRTFARHLAVPGSDANICFREPKQRDREIVAICDISGSMRDYSRVFLHFLQTLGRLRCLKGAFTFGTCFTSITRELLRSDPDAALGAVADRVADWAGGTRIGPALRVFNTTWARRMLGTGELVLLFTDGLECEPQSELADEMARLRRMSQKLIWLNPLLRYDKFEPQARGIRLMLPHVDAFRPIHNLASVEDLCRSLARTPATANRPDRGVGEIRESDPSHSTAVNH